PHAPFGHTRSAIAALPGPPGGQPLRALPRLRAAVGQALPVIHLERTDVQTRAGERRGARRIPGPDPRPGPTDRRVAAARGASRRPLAGAAYRRPGQGIDRLSAPPRRARRRRDVAAAAGRCDAREASDAGAVTKRQGARPMLVRWTLTSTRRS